MSDRNQKKPDDEKKPTTTIEKDGAQQPTDAELDRVEGGMGWGGEHSRNCSDDCYSTRC